MNYEGLCLCQLVLNSTCILVLVQHFMFCAHCGATSATCCVKGMDKPMHRFSLVPTLTPTQSVNKATRQQKEKKKQLPYESLRLMGATLLTKTCPHECCAAQFTGSCDSPYLQDAVLVHHTHTYTDILRSYPPLFAITPLLNHGYEHNGIEHSEKRKPAGFSAGCSS